MEYRIGGLLFTSKFDSGNLARVERIYHDDDEDPTVRRVGDPNLAPDYEFNVWTKPDCGGTEFENGNRSWFHFAVKGCPMNKLMKINIMNMNKQGKLYSQGMAPVVCVLPQKPKWERIRDRPSYETVDGQFILSFTYRFEYRFSSVFLAFCYPYSYLDCQQRLDELDAQFANCQSLTTSSPANSIYYHRELLCYSLDRLRVDMMTVTSCHGLTNDREPRLSKLFPDKATPRAHKFKGKRVFILTSRVHPGETPASFVFNGFLDFILRPKDPRAVQLRKQYIFKLIPLLNPDGVQRGHYRTDQRGINLNRVYLDPDFSVHPTIYAAKSLIQHHHVNSRVSGPNPRKVDFGVLERTRVRESCNSEGGVSTEFSANADLMQGAGEASGIEGRTLELDNQLVIPYLDGDVNGQSSESTTLLGNQSGLNVQSNATKIPDGKYSSEIVSRSRGSSTAKESSIDGDSGGEEDDIETFYKKFVVAQGISPKPDPISTPTVVKTSHQNIPPKESGIAFYVDLHGHASKRGCFIYGNHFEEEESHVDNLLFPKLIAMNSAHFDFDACNFTEKNMYTKDKRDGMSKEGSGRVAVHKATGIIQSYTLECNYNSGRFVNSLSPATMDDGRATPPPLAGYPPKYTPSHFEEVGRAVAISALDMTNTNPWSRLASTEHGNITGLRAWVQRYVRSMRGAPSLPKKMARVASKTSSIVASATASTQQNKPRFSWSDTAASQAPSSVQNSQHNPVSSSVSATTTAPAKKPVTRQLGPVRETKTTIERKKHLHQIQGSKMTSTSVLAFGSTPMRSTYPLPNQGRQVLPNPCSSNGLPVTNNFRHPKTNSHSLGNLLHAPTHSNVHGVAHPAAHGVTNPATHGVPLRHGRTLPGSLIGKHHKQNEGTRQHPLRVVDELLSNVVIKALEESITSPTKGVSKVSCASLCPLPSPNSDTSPKVINNEFPDAGNYTAMHAATLTPGVNISTNQRVLFQSVNDETLANDSGKPVKQQDSPSSEPTKRRKKPSGLKRRSASHSPSRKGRRVGRGKGSETDSEKEKKHGHQRRKKTSVVGKQSDPGAGESVPDFKTSIRRGNNHTAFRRRSSDGISPPSISAKSRLAVRFTKSHSFGENPESRVSCEVVDLNNIHSSWKPKKEVSFWM